MTKTAIINEPAPQPEIECWVQGYEPPLSELLGQVVLIEVIQVNCTGCFIHALPEAIRLHEGYEAKGLKVFAIATAFEHYEHNTLENLQHLLETGEPVGAPKQQLEKAGFLENGKLPYQIPISVAMDRLVVCNDKVTEKSINQFILGQIPDFHEVEWPEGRKEDIYRQAEEHLKNRQYHALTFEMYKLQGTPSSILIDKQGILRKVSFGAVNVLEDDIRQLLSE
ncbi:MAG TPA: TlpA family protein disulfide reductase [Gammaproteobacteria bacterium]|nr:TlpA family protein disulfide reductase [Gammaproteobacteria bacterium]